MRFPHSIILFGCAGLVRSATIERNFQAYPQNHVVGGANQQELGTATDAQPAEGLREILRALDVMQDSYFDLSTGTWPDAIDWTAAVMGTHISATLSSIVTSVDIASTSTCSDLLQWQNTIDRYFAHTSSFYFGENAFSLRNQAFDDMLWVVLGWLENVKLVDLFASKHWDLMQSREHTSSSSASPSSSDGWYGLQFKPMAAHRARIFYDLASAGWDESLCGGGMTWNPYLTPYKNAITNELFAAASIAMYLYFPGDNNTSPFMSQNSAEYSKPHDPIYLESAVKSYKWLLESQMISSESGLYQDGFHISGWHRYPNGTVNPGTEQCDELDSMVYTYNQGVILSASRGLWIATGARSYLDDGHKLVDDVIRATGWPNQGFSWSGLGRGGVLEEVCDHGGYCSQNGQTFKGIFFHHLIEFCRPLWPQEKAFIASSMTTDFDQEVYQYHLARCAAYDKWISHNADAATATLDSDGRFGMWWTFGRPDGDAMSEIEETTILPPGVVDYRNPRPHNWPGQPVHGEDINDRGRGRTVETQSGGLAVLRARWTWDFHLRQFSK